MVRWEPPMELYDHTVFFHVNDVPDTIDLLMAADTHHLSPADMETLVRRMEDVLVSAVLDPEARDPFVVTKGGIRRVLTAFIRKYHKNATERIGDLMNKENGMSHQIPVEFSRARSRDR